MSFWGADQGRHVLIGNRSAPEYTTRRKIGAISLLSVRPLGREFAFVFADLACRRLLYGGFLDGRIWRLLPNDTGRQGVFHHLGDFRCGDHDREFKQEPLFEVLRQLFGSAPHLCPRRGLRDELQASRAQAHR